MSDLDQPQTTSAEPATAGGGLLASLPDILWQRRLWLIVPTILAGLAGIATVLILKPVYTSTATILIESQQLPEAVVGTPVNDMIDARIARVRQRVLSRPDLVKIIRAQNLYPGEQNSTPLSKIVEEMREATTIEAISADVQQGARGGKSTIAFSIGFSYSDPAKAQAVAQQYVNNFLELDAANQSEQAVNAASFLTEQAAGIQDQIRQVEGRITAIKAQNGPLLALQQVSTGNPTADAARIDSEIAGIVAENAKLAANVGALPSPEEGNVAAITAQLRAAEARYSDTHPDVLALRAQLESARAAVANVPRSNVNAQIIASNNGRIASLRAAKGMLLAQSSMSQATSARAPVVAEQVAQLEARAEGLRAQYQSVAAKQMSAQVAAKMETEQKGERLTLADPPVVPDSPTWPNRPLVLAGSVVLGGGIGLGLILLLELLTRPIRGTMALARATGSPPLVVIPELGRKPSLLLRLLQARSQRRLARARR